MKLVILTSFPKSDDPPSGNKINGLKAIRQLCGIGLKEAKEVIENLQEGKPFEAKTVSNAQTAQEALQAFVSYGGKYKVNDALPNLLRQTIDTAMDMNELEIAIEVINILKRLQ